MRKSLAWTIYLSTFALFGLLFLAPLWTVIRGGFVVNGEFTLRYLLGVFQNPIYSEGLFNSLMLAIGTTTLVTLIAVPLAWLNNRYDFPGKKLVGGLILVPMILPPFVGAIGFQMVLGQYGGLNALMGWGPIDWLGRSQYWGVIILQALSLYPIMYLNASAALANLDPAMEEAAANLGCSGFRKFRKITLPLMMPGLFAGGTIVFIWSFTELGTPLILNYTKCASVQVFDALKEIGTNPFPYALVFVMLRVLPGDVAAVIAGTNATPERIASLRAEFGLDKPLVAQYGDWMAGMLHGDLGVSAVGGRPVARQIAMRAAVTFPLIVLSLLIALAIGLPLGCAAVLTRNPRLRGLFHGIAIVGGAVPALWGGLLLILLFSRGTGLLGLLPAQGFPDTGWATPGKALSCLLLPALTTGITAGASIMRYTRAAVGDMASSQAVDMAMACGMTRKQAVLRVALRLATAQLVSVVGLTFAQMITGVMVVENLFALPGLGAMLVTDVGNRDLIAVQSELFLLAAFFLLLGLVVDLTHRALDPRLKHSGVVSGKAEA